MINFRAIKSKSVIIFVALVSLTMSLFVTWISIENPELTAKAAQIGNVLGPALAASFGITAAFMAFYTIKPDTVSKNDARRRRVDERSPRVELTTTERTVLIE